MTSAKPHVDDEQPVSRMFGREGVRRFFPIFLLVALAVAFSLTSARFLQFNNLLIVAQQAVVLLVAALGMTFVVIAGSIDLSVGAIVADRRVGCCENFGEHRRSGDPSSLRDWGGVRADQRIDRCEGQGALLHCHAGRDGRLSRRRPLLHPRRPGLNRKRIFLDAYSGRTAGIPNSVLIALVLIGIAAFMLNLTVFGREVRAIGGGERIAHLSGIQVDRTKILIFVLSGLLCGMAGLLQGARAMAATAQLGEGLELDAIAAVVVGGTPLTGGVGSIQGTILGALIITILSNGMNIIGLDPYFQNIVKGVVLVLSVFITIDREKIGIIK